jgi:hypothetical protein
MDDLQFAYTVRTTINERTEDITAHLMGGQLKSMDEYAGLMGELKFIADLEESIQDKQKKIGEEEDG